MNAVRSADGTNIAYSIQGQGPPLILVDGALCSRSFGPMPKLASLLSPQFTVVTYDRRGRGASGDTGPYAVEREVEDIEALITQAGGSAYLFGASSGGALALEAAKGSPAVGKVAVYEAPFTVDDTKAPLTDDLIAQLNDLVAAGRRGDAVKLFMRFVGTPAIFTAVMPLTPVWPKLKAVAHTLPYDFTILAGHHRGMPLSAAEWAPVRVPALVAAGGKSPAWMQGAMAALAGALPSAQHRTLPGQTHMVKRQVIAPVLTGFFANSDREESAR